MIYLDQLNMKLEWLKFCDETGIGAGNMPKFDSTPASTAYPSTCQCESGLRLMFRWASINTTRLRPYSVTLQSFSPILIQMATATNSAQAAFATIDLSGYDAEQSRLMDERCIVVDEQDRAIGALDKKTCMRKYTLSWSI